MLKRYTTHNRDSFVHQCNSNAYADRRSSNIEDFSQPQDPDRENQAAARTAGFSAMLFTYSGDQLLVLQAPVDGEPQRYVRVA